MNHRLWPDITFYARYRLFRAHVTLETGNYIRSHVVLKMPEAGAASRRSQVPKHFRRLKGRVCGRVAAMIITTLVIMVVWGAFVIWVCKLMSDRHDRWREEFLYGKKGKL